MTTESPHAERSDPSNLLLFLRGGYALQNSAVYWPRGITAGLASVTGLKCCSQPLLLTLQTPQSCLISVSSIQIREEEEITVPWVPCYGTWPSRSPRRSLAQGHTGGVLEQMTHPGLACRAQIDHAAQERVKLG